VQIRTASCVKNIAFVGGRGVAADYMNGDLDEFSVYNAVLSDNEVTSIYQSGKGEW